MCNFGDADQILEISYDEGDVMWSVEQTEEPIYPADPPAEAAAYTLLRIAGGTVAVDVANDPLGGSGSKHDTAVVMLAYEGT